jgi:TonB-dependent SusC/RagA subfamily outer membrane receptor
MVKGSNCNLYKNVVTGEKIQKINPNDASTAMLMVPGLHLRGGFLTLGGLASFGASSHDEPLLIVDGVMVAGGSSPELLIPEAGTQSMGPIIGLDPNGSPLMHEISKISPDVIDFIEVLKGPEAAYYGTRSGNGVIIVNTNRRSNYTRVYENYGTLQYYPKSYHLAPQFNMPDYNNKSLKNAAFKDFRPTLYWNGHVYSSPNGKAELQFFTADATTAYTITVTGVTSSGEVIYKKAKFNVK